MSSGTTKAGECEAPDSILNTPPFIQPPTIQQKASAAAFILAMGVENVGASAAKGLMYPYTGYTDEDVRREAGNFMGDVLTVLLSDAHPKDIQTLLKGQGDRLI